MRFKAIGLFTAQLSIALIGAFGCDSPIIGEPEESVTDEASTAETASTTSPTTATTTVESPRPPIDTQPSPSGSPFQRFPTLFVENRGQASEHIDYYVHTGHPRTGFSKNSVTYVLSRPATAEDLEVEALRQPEVAIHFDRPGHPHVHPEGPPQRPPQHPDGETGWSHSWTVRVEFEGANPQARPQGREKAETIISFFKGQREDWKTAIPTFHELAYEELWAGIDLVYVDRQGFPVETFQLAPKADPSHIRIAYLGAKEVIVDENGRLLVDMDIGTFVKERPSAYQKVDGQRVSVAVEFKVEHPEPGRSIVRFVLGTFDDTKPLFIVPAQR